MSLDELKSHLGINPETNKPYFPPLDAADPPLDAADPPLVEADLGIVEEVRE